MLTDSLEELQTANGALDAALTEVATFRLLEADGNDEPTADQVTTEKTAFEGETTAERKEFAVNEVEGKEADVQTAIGVLAGERATSSDARLNLDLTEASAAVGEDGLYKAKFAEVKAAESALSNHKSAAGSDQAIADNLFNAYQAFLNAGGTTIEVLDTFVGAYTDELANKLDDQNWDVVVKDVGLVITVDDDGVVDPDQAPADATLSVRAPLREAMKVVDKREELYSTVDGREGEFTAAKTTLTFVIGAADAGTDAAVDRAEAVDASLVTLTLDGDDLTEGLAASYTNLAAFVTALNNISGISAEIDGPDLVISSLSGALAGTLPVDAFKNQEDGENLANAIVGADAGGTTDTGLGNDLRTAEADVDDRDELKQNIADAREDLAAAEGVLAELETLIKAYTDSEDARDAILERIEDDFGIESLVEVLDGGNHGDIDVSELFLFSAAETTQTITIALEADDQLFIGSGFTLNTDADFAEKQGDASVLEVFFVQDGLNTKVQIEQTAFGSNAATQEVDTITLIGVSADDLQFESGYITIV